MLNYDITTPLSDEETAAKIDVVANEIIKRRMETPGVMLLEMHKPLSYLASQSLLVAMPFLGPFVGHQRVADLSKILANSANIERLILRIEELAAARDEAEAKAAKDKTELDKAGSADEQKEQE